MRLLSITLILLSIFVNAKPQNDTIINNKATKILEDKVSELEKKISKFENFKSDHEEIIKQTSQTIDNQNALISSFGVIYTILTIVIAFMTIGLPIIVYQFGIKPSKQALKELEENINKKVSDFLIGTRNKQIKQAIENLKSENAELKAKALLFLSATQHDGFSDQEFFEFYRLIKSNKLSSFNLIKVLSLISSSVNEFANEIFADTNYLKNPSIKEIVIHYILKAGFEKFITSLKEFIKDNNPAASEFDSIIVLASMYSSDLVEKIINNKDLVDCLDVETLKHEIKYQTFT